MVNDEQATAAWQLGATQVVTPIAHGTVNRTLLVEIADERFVLRAYRHSIREPIEREHLVIRYAKQRGVPVVAPLPLPNGETIYHLNGAFYALFPFASGVQIDRSNLGINKAAAIGRCLATLHQALESFPHKQAVRRSFSVRNETTLARIVQIEQAIAALPQHGQDETFALATLQGMREYILCTAAPETPLDALPLQLIHGDFQERNLFFEHGEVSAVIDWDQTFLAPRGWELLRTMHFVWNFEPAPCQSFLHAYLTLFPLAKAELQHAARWYAFSRGHNLWVLEATYLGDNKRTRQFISPQFDPIEPLWDRVVDAVAQSHIVHSKS